MINEGKLVRIDIGPDDARVKWRTLSGAMIGITETEVAAIYGNRLQIGDHPYLGDAGSYLVLPSSDRRYRMIFETATPDESEAIGQETSSARSREPNSKKRVTDFRAGLAGPVGYIEGCS
jgi:hypothetical protein